jgi:hypothetical protein
MHSKILKISTVSCALLVAILISSCEGKKDLANQITVTINSVDEYTRENRVNMFDTIEVREARIGFPVRRYVKVAEYITDSTGSVKVKLYKNEEYLFMLSGKGKTDGSLWFSKEDLSDGENVKIEAKSFENR